MVHRVKSLIVNISNGGKIISAHSWFFDFTSDLAFTYNLH